jgi:hypothetical protein
MGIVNIPIKQKSFTAWKRTDVFFRFPEKGNEFRDLFFPEA